MIVNFPYEEYKIEYLFSAEEVCRIKAANEIIQKNDFKNISLYPENPERLLEEMSWVEIFVIKDFFYFKGGCSDGGVLSEAIKISTL